MSSEFKRTFKFFTIDGFTTSSVMVGEVASLEHKLGDDTVKNWAFVSIAVLASGELAKVFCSFRNYVIVELEDDPLSFCSTDRYIELKKKG